MLQAQSYTEASRTKVLLAKLNLAIDEAQLVKKIVALQDDLRSTEGLPEQILKTYSLKKRIAVLETKLQAVRNQIE